MFFFNDTATTEIYTLSLHDALPISVVPSHHGCSAIQPSMSTASSRSEGEKGGAIIPSEAPVPRMSTVRQVYPRRARSEEHTSELQSRQYLVCRLLLEKKKKHLMYAH